MCFFFRGTILLRMICISALAKSFRFKRTINHAKHNCVWGMWNGLPHCKHRQIHRYQNTHTHTHTHTHTVSPLTCSRTPAHTLSFCLVSRPSAVRCHSNYFMLLSQDMFPQISHAHVPSDSSHTCQKHITHIQLWRVRSRHKIKIDPLTIYCTFLVLLWMVNWRTLFQIIFLSS